jgi:anti-anti-sigma regulatory factor
MDDVEFKISEEYFSYEGIYKSKEGNKHILISCKGPFLSSTEGGFLKKGITQYLETGGRLPIMLDVNEVTSIDPSGLNAMIVLYRFCDILCEKFFLFNSQKEVKELIKEAQLGEKFNTSRKIEDFEKVSD